MRPRAILVKCKFSTLLPSIFLTLLLLSSYCRGISNLIDAGRYQARDTPMHKVLLTQRGYIQFLRWELPVPEFKEFTFCLWLNSRNLTLPHSIFSYSKDERDRLVRGWVSSGGRSVHLEIGGKRVFVVSTNIRENRWYHICQSWESQTGRYALWIDGRIEIDGYSEETINHVIPRGGDIVLGQEYTDFDKGLEEGVEGAVLGFNLLLASSFPRFATNRKYVDTSARDSMAESSVQRYYVAMPFLARIPMRIMRHDVNYDLKVPYGSVPIALTRRTFETAAVQRPTFAHTDETLQQTYGRRTSQNLVSNILPSSNSTRNKRDILKVTPVSRGYNFQIGRREIVRSKVHERQSRLEEDPLGLQLVKLSYVHCEIGRGSPFIGGPLMLISWSRTPVRIFGGATLKNVRADCGNFGEYRPKGFAGLGTSF